jgi:hypothetical protein
MARIQPKTLRRQRGAAILEFALVVPLLITMLLFSLFFTEIVRGKIKLQEAARFASFEMTSYTLTDFGSKDHAKAFSVAQKAVKDETEKRYKDFDSVEDSASFNPFATFDPVKVEIIDDPKPIGLFNLSVNTGPLGPVIGAVDGAFDKMLDVWGFNTHGRIQVKVSSAIHPTLLPQHFMDTGAGARFGVDQWGGQSLASRPMSNTLWMVATGWDLPDGEDSNATQGRAGRHGDKDGSGENSGLYTEVNRMTYFGLKNALNNIPGIGGVVDKIGFFIPALMGTFVVSHNYKPGKASKCNNWQHPAEPGEQNFDDYPGVDVDDLRCFDTSPFRDTAAYTPGGTNDSLYEKMFLARGPNFMGCKNPQADDPTFQSDPENTDKDKDKTNCD